MDAAPHLIKRLSDTGLLVRSVSAQSLGELGDLRALDPLLDALKYETHILIRKGLVYGLGGMIDERAANALYTIAIDPQEDVDTQSSVVTALVKMHTFGESTLRRVAKNAPNTETRADAKDALRMYFS
jgi:HEAT repeat protein